MGLMPLRAAKCQNRWCVEMLSIRMGENVETTHLALLGDETAVVAVEAALVAVVGLRVRGSCRRFETPASLVPVNEELDLPCFELFEKLCFMELEVDLNILAGLLDPESMQVYFLVRLENGPLF